MKPDHLTAEDREVDEFIRLRRLNRNVFVVIDSDKKSAHSRINATKKRIRDEIGRDGGGVWVTSGRAIENYIAPNLLREAVEAIKPGFGRRVKQDRFQNALPVLDPRSKEKRSVDKLKVAHEVASRDVEWDMLDLRKQVERLVQFIRHGNRD